MKQIATASACRTAAFVGAAFCAAASALTIPASADSVADFYKGKTIDFYIGYSPGGTYDLYARLVSRFMGDHIPGKPVIVTRNMPGAGSRTAAGYVANVAPHDGAAFGTADEALSLEQVIGDKTLQFDASQLQYIGNPIVVNNVMVTWAASGVKTIEDAKHREVTMGATGPTASAQYPTAANRMLGTKFKIVSGYPGGNDINFAMENGEVEGRGSNDWVSWKATKPDWIANQKINILVQIGLTKEHDLPNVPLLMDLATNDEDKEVLKLLSSPVMFGRPVFTSPGVPSERMAALRKAFDDTMKDREFIAEAAREKLEINPVSGLELQAFVADMMSTTPKAVAGRLRDIIDVPQAGDGVH
jgi:tripartite-type tricarboxylate transporter receptor subunit TctC